MALTLQQIIRRTTGLRKSNAKYVRLVKLTTGHWKVGPDKGLGYVAAQSYSTHVQDAHGVVTRNPDQTRYVTVITFIDSKLHVRCSCSCPDFLYRWEVALNNKGAAEIEYSNGALPNITNPQMRPASCKHLVCLYERIKNKLPQGS